MAEFQQTRIDTSEYQHPITTPEQLPPPNFSEIAQRSKTLALELEKTEEIIFDGPNGEYKDFEPDDHPVSRIIDGIMTELGEPDDFNMHDVTLDLRSRLEVAEPDAFSLVSSAIDEKLRIDSETEALDQMYGEAMVEYRDAAVGHVAAYTDWDKVIEVFMADAWPENASLSKEEVFNHLYHLSVTGRYNTLHSNYDQAQNAERLSMFANSIGGTLKEPTPQPEQGWFDSLHVSAGISKWKDATKKVFNYMDDRRKTTANGLLARLEYEKLDELANLSRRMELDSDHHTKALVPLAAAFERHLEKVFAEYDEQEAKNNHIEVGKRPDILYIGTAHRDILEQNAGISDVPTWIYERLQRFHNPKREGLPLSSGIGFIEFTNKSEDSHQHGGTYSTGEQKFKENRIYIDVRSASKKRQDAYAREKDYSPDVVTRVIEDAIGETFDHEVGHHIHGAVLSVKELRVWQAALEAEPDRHINEYIERLTNENMPETRMQQEQFATRLAMYMNEPLDLAFKYPKSFAALNGILGKFNGGNVEVLMSRIRSLQESGRTGDAERLISFFKYGPTS